MDHPMSLLGLIVGIVGGSLGAFSILVTWKLYQAGVQIHLQTVTLLAEIKKSSHTTEITSTRFTERLVEALIELQGRDVKSSLVVGRATLTERMDELLAQALSDADQELAKKIKHRVNKELANTFRTLEFQTASLTRLPGSDLLESSARDPKTVIAAGLPSLLKWIFKNDHKYNFFSVKFLQEKVFAGDPVVRQALQFAIDNDILELYDQPNPKNPAWPTKACRVKRNHPVVQAILSETGEGSAA